MKVKRVFLGAALAACLALSSSSASAQSEAVKPVQAVQAVGMTVSDLDRAVEFYSKVLSFEKVSEVETEGSEVERLQGVFGLRIRRAHLKLGEELIELTEYLAPKGRPIPADTRSQDRWFQHIAIIVSNMDKAYAWLRQNKITHASTGPQTLPETIPAAAGIRAFYFKDPDGHHLEILEFPPGKGDPKWRAPSERLFLGIDHTALVVSNTEASLAFYRDTLGLRVAGESLNSGTEQEHLNNVFGARVRITALRSMSGPGIEFLEYLTPRDGRPMPLDEKANDLMHWQTTLVTTEATELARRIESKHYDFVSTGVVALPDKRLGFEKGFLVRDPDGHVMQVIERRAITSN